MKLLLSGQLADGLTHIQARIIRFDVDSPVRITVDGPLDDPVVGALAEKIVLAVNSHGPLVKALAGLVEMIENAAANGLDTTGYIGVGDAFAALRLARGEA